MTSDTTAVSTTNAAVESQTELSTETAGLYPGDGSNGHVDHESDRHDHGECPGGGYSPYGTDASGGDLPGCYAGRWPRIHFEAFPGLGSITDAGNNILISQIAIPEETCTAVYGGTAYEDSVENLNNITRVRCPRCGRNRDQRELSRAPQRPKGGLPGEE